MKSFFSCSTMARLLLLLSIPATMLIDPIAGQPSSHHQHRRSPMGFQGVRGKRSTTDGAINSFAHPDYYSDSATVAGNSSNTMDKINNSPAAVGVADEPFSATRHYVGGLPTISLSKRAPVGFMGMRGKKEYETMESTLPFDESSEQDAPLYKPLSIKGPPPRQTESDFGDEEQQQESDNGRIDFSYDDDFGRGYQRNDIEEPRNKKLFFSLPYRFIPKRAPSGFMGMRGKKFLDGSFKRGPSGFMGMRGKKAYGSPLIDLLRESMERNELARAGADSSAADYDDIYNDYEKRGPSGFMGMRGKKWNDLLDEYLVRYNSALRQADEKRSPKMGFHGMRGKRSVDPFFGSSQGGSSRANYFSVMKKVPYEFRGKFVGVRGKKSGMDSGANYIANDLQSFNGGVEDTQDFEKRTPNGPSGFLGMRGKKS